MPLPAALLYGAGALAGTGTARAALGRFSGDEEEQAPPARRPRPRSRLPDEIQGPARERLEQGLERIGVSPNRPAPRQQPRRQPPPEEAGFFDRAGDVAVDVARAVPGTARSLVGLANIPLGGALEPLEESLAGAQEWLGEHGFSEERQREEAAFAQSMQEAMGREGFGNQFMGGLRAAAENPAVTAGMLPQILAEMTVGSRGAGLALRGTRAGGKPLLAGAAGEGAIAAGHLSADIGANTEDEYKRLLALPAGAAVGAIGYGGNALVSRMASSRGPAGSVGRFLEQGTDPETAAAGLGAAKPPPSQGNLVTRMGAGFVREGGEEFLQAFPEGAATNIAEGQPVLEGVGAEAGVGTLLGGMLGAGFSAPNRAPPPVPEEVEPASETAEAEADTALDEETANDPTVYTAPDGSPATRADMEDFIRTQMPEQQEQLRAIMAAQRAQQEGAQEAAITPEEAAEAADIAAEADAQAAPPPEAAPTPAELLEPAKPKNIGERHWRPFAEQAAQAQSQEQAEELMQAAPGFGEKRIQQMRDTEWYQRLGEQQGPRPIEFLEDAKPKGVGDRYWRPFAERAAEVQTQEEAETVMEQMPGFRDKRKEQLRQSEWYRLLGEQQGQTESRPDQETTPEQPSPVPPAEEPTTPVFSEQEQQELPEEQIRSSLQGLSTEEIARDLSDPSIGETLRDRALNTLEEGQREEVRKRLQDPDSLAIRPGEGRQRRGVSLPNRPRIEDTSQMRALTRALEGYGEPVIDSTTGKEHAVGRRRRQSVERNLDADTIEMFNRLHRATKKLDSLDDAVSKSPLKNEAGKPAEEVEVVTDLGGRTMDTAELLELDIDQRVQQREEQARRVEKLFTELADKVGANNLRRAMAQSKSDAATTTRESTGLTRLDTETGPATRASMRFSQLTRGELEDPSIPGQPIRMENRLLQRLSRIPGVSSQNFRKIAEGERTPQDRREKARQRNPVENLLNHFGATSASPTARLLARRLKRTLERKRAFRDGNLQLDIRDEAHPEGIGAQFLPGEGGAIGTIRVYRGGQSQQGFLHEAVHATTLAAIYDDPGLVQPQTRNLLKIAEQLQAVQTDETFVRQYGESAAQAVTAVRGFMGSRARDAQHNAIAELVAYGLTDRGLQDWMQDTPMLQEAEQLPAQQGLRIWDAFVIALKRLVGAGNVPNSAFETFLEATNAVLRQAETAPLPSDGSTPLAPEPLTERTRFKPLAIKVTPENAEQLTNTEQAARAYAAHKAWKAREEKLELGLKARREQSRRRRIEEGQESVARDESRNEELARRGETSVPQRRIGSAIKQQRGLTLFDRVPERIFSQAAKTLSNGRYNSWEQFINERVFERGGQAVERAGTAREGRMIPELVGGLISTFYSEYGVNQDAQSVLFEVQSAVGLDEEGALTVWEHLSNQPLEQQEALYQYIRNRDDALLERSLGPEKAGLMRATVETMEKRLASAKALGIVDPGNTNKPVADIELIDLFKIADTARYKHKKGPKAGGLRALDPRENRKRAGDGLVNEDALYDAQGRHSSPDAGLEYTWGVQQDGSYIFIESGADASVWQRLGAAPWSDTKDENGNWEYFPYTVEKVEKEAGEVVMSRPLRWKDVRRIKNNANVMSAVSNLMQELSRQVNSVTLAVEFQKMNAELEPDARWMTSTPPPNVDSRYILDLNVRDVADSARTRRKMRIPGYWVRLPTDAEGQRQYGDMAGQYMAGPAFTAIQDLMDSSPMIGNRTYRKFMTSFKLSNTAFNYTTHINNTLSGVVAAYLYDISPSEVRDGLRIGVIQQWPQSKAAARARAKLGPELSAVADEARDMGILLGQAKTAEFDVSAFQEMEDVLSNTSNRIRDVTNGMVDLQRVMAKTAKTAEVHRDIYSLEDNAFRIAMYIKQIQLWQERNPGEPMTLAVKQRAAKTARDAFVNYRIDAPGIKALRETIVPFIAFPYRWLGLLSKTLVLKPWKAGNLIAAMGAINALGYAMSGGADEEDERNRLPEYMRGNVSWLPGTPLALRLPSADPDNANFYYVGNFLPLGDAFRASEAGMPNFLNPSGPLMTLAETLLNYEVFQGDNIAADTDTPLQSAASRVAHLVEPYVPGQARNMYRNIYSEEILNEHDALGNSQRSWTNYANFMGLSVKTVNKHAALYGQSMEYQAIRRKFGQARSRAIRQHTRFPDQPMDELQEMHRDLTERELEQINELFGIEED